MPLWTISHSAGCLDGDGRQDLATRVTALYRGLPPFYVAVVFHEMPAGALFIGGRQRERFVRISVDQIARTLPDAAARERWTDMVNAVLAPLMAERELDWELHIDETSRELWLIQGMRPPPPGSPGERLWRERDEPVPYEPAARDGVPPG
jgi:phenylpyruvate tautomerase PptA (4-oxalocrotonate tautomerase family)